ncbi:MAG: tetratricopeptide repeat protein [Pirellulales bacterium]
MGWLKKLLGMESGDARTQPYRDVMRDYAAERARVKEAGAVDGEHYTDHVEQVKQLKRDGRYDEAIELLAKLVDATESESRTAGPGWGVAPWYYEQLAIIYRKQKRLDDEVAILERYAAQPKAPGVGPSKLAERLEKAKQLASKAR